MLPVGPFSFGITSAFVTWSQAWEKNLGKVLKLLLKFL
jgi:hypothetical protein